MTIGLANAERKAKEWRHGPVTPGEKLKCWNHPENEILLCLGTLLSIFYFMKKIDLFVKKMTLPKFMVSLVILLLCYCTVHSFALRSALAGPMVTKIGMVTQYTYRHHVLGELGDRNILFYFWPPYCAEPPVER